MIHFVIVSCNLNWHNQDRKWNEVGYFEKEKRGTSYFYYLESRDWTRSKQNEVLVNCILGSHSGDQKDNFLSVCDAV
jgi:hypothetical protein